MSDRPLRQLSDQQQKGDSREKPSPLSADADLADFRLLPSLRTDKLATSMKGLPGSEELLASLREAQKTPKEPENKDGKAARGVDAKPGETSSSKTEVKLPPPEKVKPSEPAKPVEVAKTLPADKTSPEFEKLVRQTYEKIPETLRKEMEAAGFSVKTGHHMSQLFPQLKGVRPRGWAPGTTWDYAEGTVMFDKKLVVVTEHVAGADGKWQATARTPGVLRHEFGHAVNKVWGEKGAIFSDRPEFIAAYERDVAGIKKEDRAALQYLLQAGSAGRDETFADVLATLIGGPSNDFEASLNKRAFPEVTKLIQQQLDRRKAK